MTTIALSFLFGLVDPLPPDLADGWHYVRTQDGWLRVVGPTQEKYFVGCSDGDHFLCPERVCTPVAPNGAAEADESYAYADVENMFPLPVKQRCIPSLLR